MVYFLFLCHLLLWPLGTTTSSFLEIFFLGYLGFHETVLLGIVSHDLFLPFALGLTCEPVRS